MASSPFRSARRRCGASLDGPSYRIGFQLAPDGAAASLVGLKAASGAAAGARAGARLVPGALDLSYAVSALSETRQARFGGGALVNAGVVKIKRRRRIAYDPRALPAFVPLPEPETKALLDPLTAMFLPVSGGDPGNPANCNRRLRLYDGQRRFDLVMSYVRTESGPEGARPVCAARYVPVAGHGADGDAYAASLAASRIEATLAPVAGGRFLLPVRVRFSGSGGSGEAVATSVTGG